MNSIIRKIRDRLTVGGLQGYLVGGYIRDSLLGLPTKDLDVAVTGDPYSLSRELADLLGGSFVPLGQAHQVARVALSVEAAPLRYIDISGFQGSIHQDLARRDFTVDAMALPLEQWGSPDWQQHIQDPFGGRKDLQGRFLRAVSDSVFVDDPVRMLRAVRLSAGRGFNIERHTVQLISASASLIAGASAERVRDELLAILAMEKAKDHLRTLDALGLLCYIMPELEPAKGVEQPREHYWDVFDHSVESVGQVERITPPSEQDPVVGQVPWDEDLAGHFAQEVGDGHSRRTILKLAALLHDVAKPETKKVEENGRTRFFGHHTLGASQARRMLRRLRYSRRSVDMVTTMIEHHLRPGQMGQGTELPTPRAIYRYFRDLGDEAIDTLYLNLADYLAARGPMLDIEEWRAHLVLVRHVLYTGTREQGPERMPRLVTGHDLMEALRLEPGPVVGELLEGVREAQVAGRVVSQEDALAWARKMLEVTSRTF